MLPNFSPLFHPAPASPHLISNGGFVDINHNISDRTPIQSVLFNSSDIIIGSGTHFGSDNDKISINEIINIKKENDELRKIIAEMRFKIDRLESDVEAIKYTPGIGEYFLNAKASFEGMQNFGTYNEDPN